MSASETIRIHLTDAPDGDANAEDIRQSLSAVIRVGPHLFLGCDETATLERVTDLGGGVFGEHRTFPLGDVLDLPAGEDEVDVEGLAWDAPYLWILGSHSRKRGKVKDDTDAATAFASLADVDTDDNRYLLARIPLEADLASGGLVPRRSCPHPDDPARTLTAARLRGKGRRSELVRALRRDPHLKRFIKIPGKDNGLDIEGLAVRDGRVYLGLRGPVLRGWAVVLEVQPVDAHHEGRLKLRPLAEEDRPYRKHVLDLDGLGIRELAADGDDLLVLAGPTMAVRAPAGVFRWPGALTLEEDAVVPRGALQPLAELPHDVAGGADHPEGMCRFDDGGAEHRLLVVYDSASARRQTPDGVLADVFDLPRARHGLVDRVLAMAGNGE